MKGLQFVFFCCLAAGILAQDGHRRTGAKRKHKKEGNRLLGGVGGFHGGFGGGGGFGEEDFVSGGFGGDVGGLGGAIGGSATCRYLCRTPAGQAYCCENNHQPQGPVGLKPGYCPPVRPVCPPVRNFGPPQTCSNDYSCGGVDKCCFDTCLQEHVCKPPQGFGGFGR